jgi:hypothetical protein
MITQVVEYMYLEGLFVLRDDKQIILEQNYRKKYNEDDSFVDVCLSDRGTIISLEENVERERGREGKEEGEEYMNLSHLL